MAEAIPSLENGLWKLLSDGRMETSWTIRENAQWHDGVPLTTADLLFAIQLGQDREIPYFRHAGFDSFESATAMDARTITVRWKRPYIDADQMFARSPGGTSLAYPRPKHLLENLYLEDKANLQEWTYWGRDFVGAGPYKVREWVVSSHLVLTANDRFALGRPKIDEIEIRWIADAQTLVSTMLAGAADLTLNTSPVSVEEGVRLQEQWKDGRVAINFSSWIPIAPQLLNPTPAIVGNVQFRRALMHAMDRQQLSDSIMAGKAPIAHGFLPIDHPFYPMLEPYVVKYDYDPRKAAQLLEDLGYVRSSDGLFRDRAGEDLSVVLRTGAGREEEAFGLIIADQWKVSGVRTELESSRKCTRGDRECTTAFSSFYVSRLNYQLARLRELRTSERPTPENNFIGQNRPRYSDPALDTLIDRFLIAVPLSERIPLAGQIIHQLSDQVVFMGLVYNAETALVNNKVRNVYGRTQPADIYHAHLWELV